MARLLISNLANLLSLYRLAAAPVAAWMAFAGHRDAFFVLIIVSLATDLVDGPISRWSGRGSATGAKLDTIADACTVLAGIFGLYLFERDTLRPEIHWLYIFLSSYAAAMVTSLIKFGSLPAYHLYLAKTAALAAGAFFIWLYLIGYSRPFLLSVIGLGILANIESILVTLLLRNVRTDIGSLIFLLPSARGDDR